MCGGGGEGGRGIISYVNNPGNASVIFQQDA